MLDNKLIVEDLGIKEYDIVWAHQTKIHELLKSQNKEAESKFDQNHTLILCEHPHVYTIGKSGKDEHLIIPESQLGQINASFYRINRGGDITYHGPGQLVAYPILDLNHLFTDVHKYVRMLEETIIQILANYNILGERIKEYTGVWIDAGTPKARKICAIGVHLSRWVSLHGLAFNVNSDLSYFNHIVPCGITSNQMSVTSMEKELGIKISMDEIKSLFAVKFAEIFNLKIDS
ncbi:MAG: lipoyl(octanoyl) transferase LipB [Saprospiraceae bacterium]